MNSRQLPPHPELLRKPTQSFGWLDARLLHEGWVARIGSDGIAVMALLAIAADKHGASFYNRDKMAQYLSMTAQEVDRALARLQELGLVAYQPWRPGCANGIWQLMPVPTPKPRRASAEMTTLRKALSEMAQDL